MDPSADESFSIQAAAQHGHTKIVQQLLKDKRISTFGVNSAIIRASEGGHLDLVKELLLDERMDPELMKAYSKKAVNKSIRLDIIREIMAVVKIKEKEKKKSTTTTTNQASALISHDDKDSNNTNNLLNNNSSGFSPNVITRTLSSSFGLDNAFGNLNPSNVPSSSMDVST